MPKSTSHLSRFLILIAVFTVGTCSTVMNWRFGGSPFDGQVIATMSVALDVIKWLAPVCASIAYAHRAYLRAAAALLIWVVCIVWSMAAAMGFSALSRDAIAAERAAESARHVRAHEAYERASADLILLKASPRWSMTSGCTNVTAKSVELCTRLRDTERRLQEAETVLASSKQQRADPQAELLAQLVNLPIERTQVVLATWVAITTELVSSLGFFAVSGGTSRNPDHEKRRPPRKARARRRSNVRAAAANGNGDRLTRAQHSMIVVRSEMRKKLN
jgi:hypothetical protein